MTDLLDVLMGDVLAKMSVISEQRGRTYDGVSVHGGERSQIPSLSEKPLVDYYRDRFNNAHSQWSRRTVLLEALEGLRIARRMPIPIGQEPVYGSPQWKRFVAESREDVGVLATRFNVTRRYINMVRRQYRDAA